LKGHFNLLRWRDVLSGRGSKPWLHEQPAPQVPPTPRSFLALAGRALGEVGGVFAFRSSAGAWGEEEICVEWWPADGSHAQGGRSPCFRCFVGEKFPRETAMGKVQKQELLAYPGGGGRWPRDRHRSSPARTGSRSSELGHAGGETGRSALESSRGKGRLPPTFRPTTGMRPDT